MKEIMSKSPPTPTTTTEKKSINLLLDISDKQSG